MGNINPFRYRGYYWDTELLLYYLQSRYYDPALGRFISPDNTSYLLPDTIDGLNLYSYCWDDPINYYDPDGHFVITAALAKILTAAAALLIILAIELTLHPIQNTIEAIGEGISDLLNSFQSPEIIDNSTPENISSDDLIAIEIPLIVYEAEHTKKRPSTKGKHQKGQKRKITDKPGGEKGDIRRKFRRNGKHTVESVFLYLYLLILYS